MLRKLTTGAAVALLVSFAGSPALQADEAQPTVDELMVQIEWMQAQMATLLEQVRDIQAENEALTADTTALKDDTAYLEEEVEILDDRVMVAEKHAILDKVRMSGEFRFQAHSIQADIPDHFNGTGIQGDLVNTLFYFQANGAPPMDLDQVNGFIQDNYADYLFFTDNLTFEDLKGAVGQIPPELMEQLMPMLAQNNFVPGYNHDNDIVYTNRLRLRVQADVAEDVKFDGRLAMYKTWGDSTGVQVFNGQPTSINWDGTTASVPNSDVLRVERAYFTWSDIAGLPAYLSIGRRPSTGGAPLNFREDEPRGGTPLGSLINYQFDGITLGYHLMDESTIRLCYGVGYESEWGNGSELQRPADRLDDAWFLGLNWDIWDTERMFIQGTYATAQDVSDGFNGLVVLPVDPLTGQDVPGPGVLRYSPSSNIGDIDLASLIVIRHDGPFDYFASINYSSSSPENVTTPFGGLFSDPFEVPDDEDGHMYYAGVRYNFAEGRTKIGAEFNHGSKYWFNFALAEDDFLAPKTSVRGDVWELYVTHRIRDSFVLKLDYIDYSYDYSGSGWLLGSPKDLSDNPPPVLGFPTYDDASKWMLSFSARF
jgi:hypothetical protein